MEVVYLYSRTNRHFSSAQRKILIQKAVAGSKKKTSLCPLNNGTACEIYDMRPARCLFYGIGAESDLHDFQEILNELSRSIFLALSGHFLPEKALAFSVSDTISGKFVQKYFHHMMGNSKT